MKQNCSDTLNKREGFAIALRKKKKNQILSLKRTKLYRTSELFEASPRDIKLKLEINNY
jgi:hypothetical protein